MPFVSKIAELYKQYIHSGDQGRSDYFGLIRALVAQKNQYPPVDADATALQREIDAVYELVRAEMVENHGPPVSPVKFGTSGWRGILGKDLFVKSVRQVTRAIIAMYEGLDDSPRLAEALGVTSLAEARQKGCVLGFDNRFGGELLARSVMDTLTSQGFTVHYTGEATTGTLSAAVIELKAACSINLTPSHNPLDYGGIKFNAADAGPAAPLLTDWISNKASEIIRADQVIDLTPDDSRVSPCDALATWISLVRKNKERHGLDYDRIIAWFETDEDLVVVVDCVHGASRNHIRRLFNNTGSDRLIILRGEADPTFGGIAPEPSSTNMQKVHQVLKDRPERLKLGVIMDPDADRIRFTDGTTEISMNHFGALAYHHLHENKKKQGMVAKSVATSNFANALAEAFGEEIFEPRVGFKEFRPVIHSALVCFEESDGITLIGHTPEKDAYIGLILALDMMEQRRQNLGDYLREVEALYGGYFPDRDGVTVRKQGAELVAALNLLSRYGAGDLINVGYEQRLIKTVIDIDGRKIIFADGSWIMIRPSGTEPKVRFYVEARTREGKEALFASARTMLTDIGLL